MILYILIIGMTCKGDVMECVTKINAYGNKIGVVRFMSLAECEGKRKKLDRFIKKNDLGEIVTYCRGVQK